jgi:hypothetical protein
MNGQPGFFDVDERLAELSAKGDQRWSPEFGQVVKLGSPFLEGRTR